jgi:23S rRNA (cytidine2498-2'-O)-methyltransferase
LPTTIAELGEMIEGALAAWQELSLPAAVSLQVWASGSEPPALPVRMDEFWKLLAEGLRDEEVEVGRAGHEHVLSVCVTPGGIVIGSNRRDSALSDWPGGRVRLAKPKGQISRSEFKLEELLRSNEITLPEGVALDLGASPGGWTRILRERGMTVWAIDPGNLDPRLVADRGVHHVRTTAGSFFHTSERTFDLIVNDMRMTPALSTELMLTASGHLNPSGMIIQTLKISPHHGLEMVRNALSTLRRRYDIDLVRQLHHNRNEVTVVAHSLNSMSIAG